MADTDATTPSEPARAHRRWWLLVALAVAVVFLLWAVFAGRAPDRKDIDSGPRTGAVFLSAPAGP